MSQLAIQFDVEIKKPRKVEKRIHYETPTYQKFYAIYQYDKDLFSNYTRLLKNQVKCIKFLTTKQIYKLCWVKDENGLAIRDSDENSIFRIKTLQTIHGLIYTYCGVSPFVNTGSSKHSLAGFNIIAHHEDKQAEIENTWQLSIKERLKLHIELLRRLQEEK